MATSRNYYEEEQVADPRPSRTRRVPTYLEDYVHDYPPLRHGQPSPADGTQGIPHVSQDPYISYRAPASRDRDCESEKLHHLEARWRDLSSEMRELQIRMDSARQASFPSRSPVHGHYQSLPHADLGNTGLEPSATVASSPHYEETLYHEPPVQHGPQSSMQPSNIARVASLPGPQHPRFQRLFPELLRSESWPPTAAQPAQPQTMLSDNYVSV
ncbi:General transcriptional corepressor ssn6 [Labeo rohita]|uniref:General transcriptional corepressor ssn6 n=1 Tax=Labeo rohita TaxID=84645 RepID=A0ABQ8L9X3_LABRO|nr:General transcriptional corepressor ssn6 [Labeo rohita]